MGPLPASPGCDCQICRPEASYDDLDRSCIDTVLQHGWQVTVVSNEVDCECCAHEEPAAAEYDEEEDAASPGFAYTVGLGHRAGHPELLMSGLDPSLMLHALDDVAQRVLGGRRLAPGDVLEGVLGHVPVVLERVTDDGLARTVLGSGWFHRRKPEALAVVWPSTSGVFAWQPGAPAVLDEQQPPAWREPIAHADGVTTDPLWPLPVPPDQRAFSCVHVVEAGAPILYVARQSGGAHEEDWTIHCGESHDADEVRLAHVAHLVRSAPSVRAVADLGLDEEADRPDTDTGWSRSPIVDD